jgi:hypothetical protein
MLLLSALLACAPKKAPVASAEAPVVVDGPVILGALPKATIVEVISADLDAIKRCYETSLQQDPTLQGQLVVKFVVSATGAVQSAETKSSELADAEMEACVNEVFRGMQFPEPEGGGIVIVSYPFVFEPG